MRYFCFVTTFETQNNDFSYQDQWLIRLSCGEKNCENISNGCSGNRCQTSCCVSFCFQYTYRQVSFSHPIFLLYLGELNLHWFMALTHGRTFFLSYVLIKHSSTVHAAWWLTLNLLFCFSICFYFASATFAYNCPYPYEIKIWSRGD